MRRFLHIIPAMLMLLFVVQVQAQDELPDLPPEPDWHDLPADGAAAAPPADRSGARLRSCSPDQALLVPHDQTRVAVLGYHNFSKTEPVTEMLMRTDDFRAQMQYIRDNGLTVISMEEFLEWRFGRRELPARCVLITLDDGWRSVYTDAYPILREFGFPFTLFLYPDFLTGRGNSLSVEMVREMMKNGATIGSHSLTHPYPSEWKAAAAQGDEANVAFIDEQLGKSREKLSQLFGPITTFCYPGGYHTPVMLERMPSYGYTAAFTVVPGKVTDDEPAWQIHRYMIFGTDESVFRRAMDFRTAQLGKMVSTGAEPGTLPRSTPLPPFPVSPRPRSVVSCEVPVISAQLSGVAGIDFSSVRMSVSGFGRVPAKVDHSSRTIEWTPPCRIYMPSISVHVTWNTSDGTSHKAEWCFQVDQNVTAQ